MDTHTRYLRFVFVGSERPWKPLKGSVAPDGNVFEVQSLPGCVVATAATRHEAQEKLKRMLERCFERAGGAEKWYEHALSKMTPEMVDALNRWAGAAITSGAPRESMDDNVEIFNVDNKSAHDTCAA